MDCVESDTEGDLPELNLLPDLMDMGCVDLISNVFVNFSRSCTRFSCQMEFNEENDSAEPVDLNTY